MSPRRSLLVIFVLVIVLPVGILVFTSLQPFYEGLTWESFERLHARELCDLILAPGSFREFDRQHARARRRHRDRGGAVHGAVRLARGAPPARAPGCSTRSPRRRWCFRRS